MAPLAKKVPDPCRRGSDVNIVALARCCWKQFACCLLSCSRPLLNRQSYQCSLSSGAKRLEELAVKIQPDCIRPNMTKYSCTSISNNVYTMLGIGVREGILLEQRKKFALKRAICSKNKQFSLN